MAVAWCVMVRRPELKNDELKNIAACLFDLDGVIADTGRYHYHVWKRFAASLGFVWTEEDHERIKGLCREDALCTVLAKGGLGEYVPESARAALAGLMDQWYLESVLKVTPLEILPGVIDFLMELHRSGIVVVLVSSCRNVCSVLERIGIHSLFDFIVDGAEAEKAKPDPEALLIGAGLSEALPEECVVFENAAAGIEAARRAGMYSIGVGDSELLDGADRIIGSFRGFSLRKLKQELN